MKNLIKYTLGLPILIMMSIGAILSFILTNSIDLILEIIDLIMGNGFVYHVDCYDLYNLEDLWRPIK